MEVLREIAGFRIERELGRGGMGEVYLARDVRLDRAVAIKSLPAHLAQDTDRLARFQREAKVLASLNHPGIGAIYGLEEAGGHQYLILEYVEGETLAQTLERGAVPVDEALGMARQIAEALEAAHEKGVVHRDLKPGNVMVNHEGVVKVLDFGLARTGEGAASTSGAFASPDSPTVESPAPAHSPTIPGAIMGTAGYMSPEQARGKSVDKRSDIFSFGCVLYEMLTGVQAFPGDTVTDSLGAILHKEPDWSALPRTTPMRVRDLLVDCLAKDRKRRLHDMGDARLAIERAGRHDSLDGATVARARGGLRERVAWAGMVVVALAAAALGVQHFRKAEPVSAEARAVQLTFVPQEKISLDQGVHEYAVVSPDGRNLVFTASAAGGKRQLWMRPLDSMEAHPLADTEEAIEPFWSPDSRSIAFNSQGKLKRVDLGAARAQTLCDATRMVGGAWSRAGVIVFSPDWRSGLVQVPDTGGLPTQVTATDAARGEQGHRYPAFLPDGHHFLYQVTIGTGQAPMCIGSLDSTETKQLLPDYAPALYAPPGWLLYNRAGVLVAQAFDAERLSLKGEPLRVAGASTVDIASSGRFSVSENGVLALPSSPLRDYQLVWFDRAGNRLGALGAPAKMLNGFDPSLSPDGKRVVINRNDFQARNMDLCVIDVEKETIKRLTTSPAFDQCPVWSPDGARVYFAGGVGEGAGIRWIAATGGKEQLVLKGSLFPMDISPDGKLLFFMQRGERTRTDLWALPLDGDRPAYALLDSEFEEVQPQASPDGRWLAYVSDATGSNEVYVRPFTPEGKLGDETRISLGGGVQPRWRRDGKELFYVAAPVSTSDGRMMAVPVKGIGATSEFDVAAALFKTHMLPNSTLHEYDVTADGERFLVGTEVGDGRPATVNIMLNWTAALKQP